MCKVLRRGPGTSALCVPGISSLHGSGAVEAAWNLQRNPAKAGVWGGLALITSQSGHLLLGSSSDKSPDIPQLSTGSVSVSYFHVTSSTQMQWFKTTIYYSSSQVTCLKVGGSRLSLPTGLGVAGCHLVWAALGSAS